MFCDENCGASEFSGKLTVLEHFLGNLWSAVSRERVVLVSAFTQTLDLLEEVRIFFYRYIFNRKSHC